MQDYPFRFSITHQTETNTGPHRFCHHSPTPDKASLVRARRLIDSYEYVHDLVAEAFDPDDAEDLWSGLVMCELESVLAPLRNRDSRGLAQALAGFGEVYTWFGGITTGPDGFNHWNREESVAAQCYFDHLLNLAVSLGLLPAELPNPGLRGNWGRNIARAPAEVASLIEEQIGITIAPRLGIIPVCGLKIGSGILHYRHVNALYAALQVRSLVAPGKAVCEYGGGLGLAAYYLWQFGYRDLWLVDLPVTNVFSGNLLMGLLGEDAVSLEGEPAHREQIKIRSGDFARDSLEGQHFGLSLNQDSFPEIDRRIVEGYLDLIHDTTEGCFLSMNHEVEHRISEGFRHLSVPALMAARTDRFRRLSRTPNWIRRGYVDEIYEVCR